MGYKKGYEITIFINSFLFSVAMCLIYIKTKNFVYPIIMHSIFNLSTIFNFSFIIEKYISEQKMFDIFGVLGCANLIVLINLVVILFFVFIYTYTKESLA